MSLELRVIDNELKVDSEELNERIKQNPKTKYNKRYVAYIDKDEVGYLSFDMLPACSSLVFYELFVVSKFRGQKLGAELLKMADVIANELDYASIIMRPNALSEEMNTENLIRWYKKMGYVESHQDSDLLIKILPE